jgi:hypothetical protein
MLERGAFFWGLAIDDSSFVVQSQIKIRKSRRDRYFINREKIIIKYRSLHQSLRRLYWKLCPKSRCFIKTIVTNGRLRRKKACRPKIPTFLKPARLNWIIKAISIEANFPGFTQNKKRSYPKRATERIALYEREVVYEFGFGYAFFIGLLSQRKG